MAEKMIAVPESLLTNIGDAIRTKRDIVTPIPVADMPMQIGMISGGSSYVFQKVYNEKDIKPLSYFFEKESITPSETTQTLYQGQYHNSNFGQIQLMQSDVYMIIKDSLRITYTSNPLPRQTRFDSCRIYNSRIIPNEIMPNVIEGYGRVYSSVSSSGVYINSKNQYVDTSTIQGFTLVRKQTPVLQINNNNHAPDYPNCISTAYVSTANNVGFPSIEYKYNGNHMTLESWNDIDMDMSTCSYEVLVLKCVRPMVANGYADIQSVVNTLAYISDLEKGLEICGIKYN